MPSYKLCYFDVRGLGEMARLLFAEAGVDYEDCRISFGDWPNHKSKMPFGKMPVLFVDGEPLANSRAIVRYVAREFKLEGGCLLTAAKADVWLETLCEIIAKLPFQEKDEAKKAELLEKLVKEELEPVLRKLEEQIESSGGPYVFGKDPTFLDFALLATCDLFTNFAKFQVADHFPRIKSVLKTVAERPKVAAWIEKRPKTEF